MIKKLMLVGVLFTAVCATAQQHSAITLDSLTNETNIQVLQQKLKTLGNGSEQDKTILIDYYYAVKDQEKADSVLQVVVKEYPSGWIAYVQAMNNLRNEPDVTKKEPMARAIFQTFQNVDKDRVYHSLAYGYANAKNVSKVMENIALMEKQTAKISITFVVARIITNYDLHAAESLMRDQINALVKAGVPAPPPKGGETGPRGNDRSFYFAFLQLYADILLKTGKYEEALRYAKDVYAESGEKNDQVKANYAILLSKNGEHKEALPLLAELVSEGKAGTEEKSALEESYQSLNPDQDATAYLASLEQGLQEKIEAEVRKMLIDEKAPDFVVKDIHGKDVSLADFKGKTIVLDFWATWCGPCIKSFPAMQKAVDKYQDDPNVRFLFIHTWERTSNPLEDAKAFINNNNYTFDLYMDTTDEKTKVNPAVTAFGARGIPAKFVIDGNGRIRFKVTGSSGGDDAIVSELSAMIDISKRGS